MRYLPFVRELLPMMFALAAFVGFLSAPGWEWAALFAVSLADATLSRRESRVERHHTEELQITRAQVSGVASSMVDVQGRLSEIEGVIERIENRPIFRRPKVPGSAAP